MKLKMKPPPHPQVPARMRLQDEKPLSDHVSVPGPSNASHWAKPSTNPVGL